MYFIFLSDGEAPKRREALRGSLSPHSTLSTDLAKDALHCSIAVAHQKPGVKYRQDMRSSIRLTIVSGIDSKLGNRTSRCNIREIGDIRVSPDGLSC